MCNRPVGVCWQLRMLIFIIGQADRKRRWHSPADYGKRRRLSDRHIPNSLYIFFFALTALYYVYIYNCL